MKLWVFFATLGLPHCISERTEWWSGSTIGKAQSHCLIKNMHYFGASLADFRGHKYLDTQWSFLEWPFLPHSSGSTTRSKTISPKGWPMAQPLPESHGDIWGYCMVLTYRCLPHISLSIAIPKVPLRLRAGCWPQQKEPPLMTGLYKHMLGIQIHCQITRN